MIECIFVILVCFGLGGEIERAFKGWVLECHTSSIDCEEVESSTTGGHDEWLCPADAEFVGEAKVDAAMNGRRSDELSTPCAPGY